MRVRPAPLFLGDLKTTLVCGVATAFPSAINVLATPDGRLTTSPACHWRYGCLSVSFIKHPQPFGTAGDWMVYAKSSCELLRSAVLAGVSVASNKSTHAQRYEPDVPFPATA